MANDFEEVKSKRVLESTAIDECLNGEVVNMPDANAIDNSKLVDSLAGNMDRIVELAFSVVEIEKIRSQSEACVKQLAEKRKLLTAEAEAYVGKLNAETEGTVRKMDIIEKMMREYYLHGHDKLDAAEFSKIISEMIDKIK